MRQATDSGYGVTFKDTVTVEGFGIVSLRTCFEPLEAPQEGEATVAIGPWGLAAAAKQFAVQVGAPPSLEASFIGTTVPTTRPLAIGLSGPDTVFNYSLVQDMKAAPCPHESSALRCDIASLDLEQGQAYDIAVVRSFGKDQVTIAEGSITTLRPIVLTDQTIKTDDVIYDKPTAFRFTFDKPLAEASVKLERLLESGTEPITTSVGREGRILSVNLDDELARQASFRLTITQAVADDGSALADPIVIPFSTSGGPKVMAVSTGTISAPTGGPIILTLDQAPADAQKARALVSVTGVSATVSVQDKQIIISYATGLCQPITIKVAAGLESAAGVVQSDAYQFSTRTQCYTTQVIGFSERGRAIISYSFGSGSKTVLFQGAMHGNEGNTKLLLDAWIGALEASPSQIPAGTRVVVIPLVNPDGYAAGSRYNANSVDLNRNFNTTDWKTDIETVYGEPKPGGGGTAPESESEAQVLAAYTSQLSPSLTLSYHSVAGYVIANTCGNSSAVAASYASLTGYSNQTGVSGAFSYEITGTYDDWMCQRLGLRSILIELATSYSAEFERNRAAMWQMLRS